MGFLEEKQAVALVFGLFSRFFPPVKAKHSDNVFFFFSEIGNTPSVDVAKFFTFSLSRSDHHSEINKQRLLFVSNFFFCF